MDALARSVAFCTPWNVTVPPGRAAPLYLTVPLTSLFSTPLPPLHPARPRTRNCRNATRKRTPPFPLGRHVDISTLSYMTDYPAARARPRARRGNPLPQSIGRDQPQPPWRVFYVIRGVRGKQCSGPPFFATGARRP